MITPAPEAAANAKPLTKFPVVAVMPWPLAFDMIWSPSFTAAPATTLLIWPTTATSLSTPAALGLDKLDEIVDARLASDDVGEHSRSVLDRHVREGSECLVHLFREVIGRDRGLVDREFQVVLGPVLQFCDGVFQTVVGDAHLVAGGLRRAGET